MVNNTINCKILNYNIDLKEHKTEPLAFIKIGKELEESYINSYNAYKKAKKYAREKRLKEEEKQKERLSNNKIKILLAGHPYNLYDDLIGKEISSYLRENNIEVIYSDKIPHQLIDSECNKLSTDIHWTHSKEVIASINYYQDKVDGIINISSFPCGPDSLSNEMIKHKIKDIPLITLIFEDLNSETGIITRLESFIDIIQNIKEKKNATNY